MWIFQHFIQLYSEKTNALKVQQNAEIECHEIAGK